VREGGEKEKCWVWKKSGKKFKVSQEGKRRNPLRGRNNGSKTEGGGEDSHAR